MAGELTEDENTALNQSAARGRLGTRPGWGSKLAVAAAPGSWQASELVWWAWGSGPLGWASGYSDGDHSEGSTALLQPQPSELISGLWGSCCPPEAKEGACPGESQVRAGRASCRKGP